MGASFWVVVAILIVYFSLTLPIVLGYFDLTKKLEPLVWHKVWQKVEMKDLPDGSVIIKEGEAYYLSVEESTIPVRIDKEEGERLWDHPSAIS